MNETPLFNEWYRSRGRPYRFLWLHKWYSSEPLVIMWCSLCFMILYKSEVRCIVILLSHHHDHYTDLLVNSFVLLSRWCVPASPGHSHLCLARWWRMSSHWEGPKNISASSEEQIPLSSYLVPCQTFRWTCKLSLWSPHVTDDVWATPKSIIR